MIATKALTGLTGLAGALALGAGALAGIRTVRFHTQRDLAEACGQVISTLSGAVKEMRRAHQNEINALNRAATASNETIAALNDRISDAETYLNERRENDATLDACLAYDAGVDLTGGLLSQKD